MAYAYKTFILSPNNVSFSVIFQTKALLSTPTAAIHFLSQQNSRIFTVLSAILLAVLALSATPLASFLVDQCPRQRALRLSTDRHDYLVGWR